MSAQEPLPNEEKITNDPGDAQSDSVTTEVSEEETEAIAGDPLKSPQGALKEKEHGLFTYYVLGGDADDNQDKKLTIGELGKYVQ